MRKRERIYLQRLLSLEKAHEQEEVVRSQLCRRLEDILLEKQELIDIIEKVMQHCNCKSFAHVS